MEAFSPGGLSGSSGTPRGPEEHSLKTYLEPDRHPFDITQVSAESSGWLPTFAFFGFLAVSSVISVSF